MEFNRKQLNEFNKKDYRSIAARYAKCAEEIIKQMMVNLKLYLIINDSRKK